MGLELEFNWYLVIKNKPSYIEDGPVDLDTGKIVEPIDSYYQTMKSGFRIYPIGGVVPIIEDEVCTGLAHIRETRHMLLGGKVETVITYDLIMNITEGDPVGNHYTDMYNIYKKKQEVENHGGKFKVQDIVNALERRSFESALKETGYDVGDF